MFLEKGGVVKGKGAFAGVGRIRFQHQEWAELKWGNDGGRTSPRIMLRPCFRVRNKLILNGCLGDQFTRKAVGERGGAALKGGCRDADRASQDAAVDDDDDDDRNFNSVKSTALK